MAVLQSGQTPLHAAAWGGHLNVVEILVHNEAGLDKEDQVANWFEHNFGHVRYVDSWKHAHYQWCINQGCLNFW